MTQKGPSGQFSSFYRARIQECSITGSLAARSASLFCCDAQTLHPTQFLLSLCCCLASAVHQPCSLGCWGRDLPAGPCTASGILQAVWSRSWASSSCSSGRASCLSSVTPVLPSPAFVSLGRGCSSPR